MKLTDLLILLCFAFSLYAWSTPGGTGLAFSEYALLYGGYYTVLTGIFVHANPVHLLGNMLFLYIFGHILEDEVGGTAYSRSILYRRHNFVYSQHTFLPGREHGGRIRRHICNHGCRAARPPTRFFAPVPLSYRTSGAVVFYIQYHRHP
jgi:hypothetical protein